MALGEGLGAVPDDLEDIDPPAVRRHLQLLVEPRELVLSLDGGEYGLGDDGLGIPARERSHYSGRLFVGVDISAVRVVLFHQWCVRVDSRFYSNESERQTSLD